MRKLVFFLCLAVCLTSGSLLYATILGKIQGIVHDPQHRPVQNAMVMIKAKSSDWSATINSDNNGEFAFNAVPLGEYVVTVAAVGFEQAQQGVAVLSSARPVLHFALNVGATKETISVSGAKSGKQRPTR